MSGSLLGSRLRGTAALQVGQVRNDYSSLDHDLEGVQALNCRRFFMIFYGFAALLPGLLVTVASTKAPWPPPWRSAVKFSALG